MKFDFSKSKDLQNKSQYTLDNINKNCAYTTHQTEEIIRRLKKIDASVVKMLNYIALQEPIPTSFEAFFAFG